MLREYAEDIEADLLYRGIDIFDWYQGKISSRRMLVLIRKLPVDSAFKTALRDDWNIDQHLSAAAVNELRAMRADLWMIHRQATLPFRPVESPQARQKREQKRAGMRALHDHLIGMMRKKS